MNELEKIIEIALKEVGYIEKKSNSQLYEKYANAGNANYTKYGKEMGCNGYAWCDAFIDWCFVNAFGKARAKELLIDFSNYTPTSANYFKSNNQFFYTPEIGDIIFFRNDIRICHTGIVYKVDNGKIYTIEGNTSNGDSIIENGGEVCKKSYAITNTRIAGYGRPKYKRDKEITTMMYGIDVSSNQGEIDFAKVKNAGVEFMILRSTTKNGNADVRLAEYIKGCYEHNIPFNAYKYMYALSESSAYSEAITAAEALKSRGIIPSKEFVIYADVEDKTQFALSTQSLSKVVNAFKRGVEYSGFSFGLYMSKSPYEGGEVDLSLFETDNVWLARYSSNAVRTLKDIPDDKYKPVAKNGKLAGWQYSSRGQVDGIHGNVDLDVFYGIIPKVEEIQHEYYATPEFTLIESLNKIGVYSSFSNRKKIAEINGILNYTGTAEQNIKMLSLLKEGKLIKL